MVLSPGRLLTGSLLGVFLMFLGGCQCSHRVLASLLTPLGVFLRVLGTNCRDVGWSGGVAPWRHLTRRVNLLLLVSFFNSFFFTRELKKAQGAVFTTCKSSVYLLCVFM